jgi:hypothetical protein
MKRWLLILGVVVIIGLVVCHREEVGWIAVNSEPQSAAVYLDDSLTNDVTNCVLEDVPVGEHTIKLTLEGYVDWDTLVEVEAETPTTITATMILESDTIDTIETGSLLWKSSIEGYPSILLYDQGTVYAYLGDSHIGDCVFSALDASDGSVKWQESISVSKMGFEGNFYGAETDYACSYNSDGSIRWKTRLESNGSPYLLAVGPSDISYWWHYDYNTDSCYVTALNSFSQKEWQYASDKSGFGGAAVGFYGQLYYLASGGTDYDSVHLYEISSEGEFVWKYSIGDGFWSGSRLSVGEDGTLYFVAFSTNPPASKIVAVDFGQLKWEYDVRPRTWLVTGEDGTIYFGSYPYLYALNPDGSLKWRKNMNTTVRVTPLIGKDETIYCDGVDGLYALDANDGAVKWKYETADEFAVGYTLALAEDGTLFLWVAENGSYYLHAIKTDSKGLANSSWPKYQADNRCSGCAGF